MWNSWRGKSTKKKVTYGTHDSPVEKKQHKELMKVAECWNRWHRWDKSGHRRAETQSKQRKQFHQQLMERDHLFCTKIAWYELKLNQGDRCPTKTLENDIELIHGGHTIDTIVSVQRSLGCSVALRVQRSSVGSALAWCMASLSWNLGSAQQGGFFPLSNMQWRYGERPRRMEKDKCMKLKKIK